MGLFVNDCNSILIFRLFIEKRKPMSDNSPFVVVVKDEFKK
jgi:hypothetical protein